MEAEVGEEGIVMREEAGEGRATKQAGSAGELRDGLGGGKEVKLTVGRLLPRGHGRGRDVVRMRLREAL